MKVYSFKLSKKTIVATAAILLGIIFLIFCGRGIAKSGSPRTSGSKAADEDQRVIFLAGLGWEAEGSALEVAEVQIPDIFDEVYTPYNDLQRESGFDLSRYKGKRVKRFTYKIINYPGNSENIRASLLVYEDTVIGGDIYSAEADGFMHGLRKNEK